MSTVTGKKFKIDDNVWFAPKKGNFVTIDVYNGTDAFGDDYENSAEEWCVEIDGELSDYVAEVFANFKGFIKLWSRRYATYNVDCYDYMSENGFDAVFVDGDEFYFCGNEVENVSITAYDLRNEEGVEFTTEDYGDDCCGWCDLFYINNGKMFNLNEWSS